MDADTNVVHRFEDNQRSYDVIIRHVIPIQFYATYKSLSSDSRFQVNQSQQIQQ